MHSGSFGLLFEVCVPIFLSKNVVWRAHSVQPPPFVIILKGGDDGSAATDVLEFYYAGVSSNMGNVVRQH